MWRPMLLNSVFESEHPYKDLTNISRTIHVPNAKFIRVIVKKFDVENKYDKINFYDKSGNLIEEFTGSGQALKSDYLEGDTIKIEFTSDGSITKWGFIIEQIEYID